MRSVRVRAGSVQVCACSGKFVRVLGKFVRVLSKFVQVQSTVFGKRIMASRKEKQRQNYLDGVARRPHSHSRTLRRSLEGAAAASSASTSSICPQCYPVLARYISVFKSMQHSGTELKKRKRSNSYPKKQDTEFQHHRDITKQNEWLRSNVFDSLGNHTHTHTPQSLSHTHTHTNSLSLSHTHTHTHRQLPVLLQLHQGCLRYLKRQISSSKEHQA